MISINKIVDVKIVLVTFLYMANAQEGFNYEKVSNLLPATMAGDKCYFGTSNDINQKSPSILPCLKHCSTVLTRCYLTCTNGEVCKFYRAAVSKVFDAPTGTEYSELTTFRCFTNYHVNGALNEFIVSLTSSPPDPTSHPASNAITGYYCDQTEGFFRTAGNNPNYLLATLNAMYEIKEIVIHARGYQNGFTTKFTNVTARVGLNEDFLRNEVFDYFDGVAGENEVVIFKNNAKFKGRYVSINSYEEVLIVSDFKIIGH